MDSSHKSPFSLYDFLGYFIPGALFFYLLVLFFKIEEIKWLDIDFFRDLRLFDQSVAFIILSYVLGHVINYLSSLTIERYSIWSIGYPSRFILGEKEKYYFKRFKNIDENETKRNRWKQFRLSFLWRLGLLVIVFPMYVVDLILGNIFGLRRHYTNSVDPKLKSIIVSRMQKFKEFHNYSTNESKGKENDYFRPIWHYYYEKFGAHAVKLDNYVALYGFTRSMSFIFCLFSWLVFIFKYYGTWNKENLILIVGLAILSYFFYLSFVKFYRRFTLEGFMCLIIDKELVDKDK